MEGKEYVLLSSRPTCLLLWIIHVFQKSIRAIIKNNNKGKTIKESLILYGNMPAFSLSWLYLNKWQKQPKNQVLIIIEVVSYCGIYSHIFRCNVFSLGITIGLTKQKETSSKTLEDLQTLRIKWPLSIAFINSFV